MVSWRRTVTIRDSALMWWRGTPPLWSSSPSFIMKHIRHTDWEHSLLCHENQAWEPGTEIRGGRAETLNSIQCPALVTTGSTSQSPSKGGRWLDSSTPTNRNNGRKLRGHYFCKLPVNQQLPKGTAEGRIEGGKEEGSWAASLISDKTNVHTDNQTTATWQGAGHQCEKAGSPRRHSNPVCTHS